MWNWKYLKVSTLANINKWGVSNLLQFDYTKYDRDYSDYGSIMQPTMNNCNMELIIGPPSPTTVVGESILFQFIMHFYHDFFQSMLYWMTSPRKVWTFKFQSYESYNEINNCKFYTIWLFTFPEFCWKGKYLYWI